MLKVSIITPCFNSQKFIEKTIQSVINQTYTNVEYIIIDGGSTDGTLDIVNKYKDNIDIIISENDKGMYDAINKGLRIATGDIIAYINSDDVYDNNEVVERIVEFFNKNKNIDWVYSDYYTIDSEDKIIEKNRIPKIYFKEFFASNWSYIPQPTTFWKRKVQKEGIFLNMKYKMAADYEFYLQLIQKYQFKKLDFIVARFRIHEDSLSTTSQYINKEEMKSIKESYKYNKNYDIYKYTFYFKYKILNTMNYIKRVVR